MAFRASLDAQWWRSRPLVAARSAHLFPLARVPGPRWCPLTYWTLRVSWRPPRSLIFPQMASHKSRLLRLGAKHHLGPRASPSTRPLKSVHTVMGKTQTCKTWRKANISALGEVCTGPSRAPYTSVPTPCSRSCAKPHPARALSGQYHIRRQAPSVKIIPVIPCGSPYWTCHLQESSRGGRGGKQERPTNARSHIQDPAARTGKPLRLTL